MNNRILKRRIVSMLVAAVLIALLQPTYAVEKGSYPPPALEQFQPPSESQGDVDGDGVNETLIRRYANQAGDSVFSLTTKDRVWAWGIAMAPAAGADPVQPYVIRDSNCDGIFNEKYGMEEDFKIPACLK